MDSWEKYQRLVLAELKRLSEEQHATREELSNLRLDFERVKTAMAVRWGIVTFVVATVVSIGLKYL